MKISSYIPLLLFCFLFVYLFTVLEIENEQLKIEIQELKQEITLMGQPEVVKQPDPEVLNWVLSRAKPNIPKNYLRDVILEAEKYDNYLLLLSIMAVESNFDPFSTSRVGAYGLAQVMPSVWLPQLVEKGILENKRQLYDYRYNIAAADYILNKYKKRFKSIELVLVRYSGNARGYPDRVLSNLDQLNKIVLNNLQELEEIVKG